MTFTEQDERVRDPYHPPLRYKPRRGLISLVRNLMGGARTLVIIAVAILAVIAAITLYGTFSGKVFHSRTSVTTAAPPQLIQLNRVQEEAYHPFSQPFPVDITLKKAATACANIPFTNTSIACQTYGSSQLEVRGQGSVEVSVKDFTNLHAGFEGPIMLPTTYTTTVKNGPPQVTQIDGTATVVAFLPEATLGSPTLNTSNGPDGLHYQGSSSTDLGLPIEPGIKDREIIAQAQTQLEQQVAKQHDQLIADANTDAAEQLRKLLQSAYDLAAPVTHYKITVVVRTTQVAPEIMVNNLIHSDPQPQPNPNAPTGTAPSAVPSAPAGS